MSCPQTPERGSYFCLQHINHTTECLFKIANDKEILIDIKNIKEKKRNNYDNVKIYDCFVDSNDDVLYLLSDMHGQYFWAKEGKIPENLLFEFAKEFSFRLEKNAYATTNCHIEKEYPIPCKKKCRTTGVLLTVYNCGIVCGYREICSSESLTQVSIFLLDILQHSESTCNYLIYDNACSLQHFLKLRKIETLSPRGAILQSMTFIIDRLHIKNHVNPNCHANFDANDFEDLLKVNTVVCEETNFWLSRFKYIMKHMNFQRFNFFLFIILDKYNEEKIKTRLNEIKKKR
jgi:hypothetical protein